MPKKIVIPFVVLFLATLVSVLAWLLHNHTFAVLEPQGFIADAQHRVFLFAIILSLFGLIPTFTFAIFVAVRYRASNNNTYEPERGANYGLSFAWWIFLVSIISVLAIVTWQTTHQFDPYNPIQSSTHKPLTIQVISLDWKWLFIYPEQNIAVVNTLALPQNTPVTLQLTADAPMSSLWIPQLSGQLYAMPGMVNKLNLMADKTGDYAGSNAEISGAGFASMRFTTHVLSDNDFDTWVNNVKKSPKPLTMDAYQQLAKPSTDTPIIYYSSRDNRLYDTIVMKYVMPSATPTPVNSPAHTAETHQTNMADMPGM
jgi:cytochrome o ubiquinol oxidase subunit 2